MNGNLMNTHPNHSAQAGAASAGTVEQCAFPTLGDRGFTLVELIMISAILGCLAMIAIPNFDNYRNSAKVSSCASDIRTIEADIAAYSLEKNDYPTSLNQIGRDTLRDPWGNPYQYLKLAGGGGPGYLDPSGAFDLNTDYDLYSLGKDGASSQSLSSGNPTSEDDIIRAGDGSYVGFGNNYNY